MLRLKETIKKIGEIGGSRSRSEDQTLVHVDENATMIGIKES
jgi:hypothetical protein